MVNSFGRIPESHRFRRKFAEHSKEKYSLNSMYRDTQQDLVTVIVTYNGDRWIHKCLESLRKSVKTTDIIVVDNASSDRTVKIIQQDFPEVKLITSDQNLGFGAANNLAIQKGLEQGYECFFLLNQDAWVNEDTLGALQEIINKKHEYGIVSPIHLNGAGTDLDRNFRWYMRDQLVPGLLGHLENDSSSKLFDVPFVNAAAWMLSRSCLMTVGKFHPLFHHYGEDDNYAHRVKASGYQIGVLAGVSIYHDREFREEPIRREEFEGKMKKALTLYLLNPLVDHGFWKFFQYTRKTIKRFRQETHQSYVASLWLGYKSMFAVWQETKMEYDLSFRKGS